VRPPAAMAWIPAFAGMMTSDLESLRGHDPRVDIDVFDGPFTTHAANRAEDCVPAGLFTFGRAHERIVFELQSAGVIALADCDEERQVNVGSDAPGWVRPGADAAELEPSIGTGLRPGLEPPRRIAGACVRTESSREV